MAPERLWTPRSYRSSLKNRAENASKQTGIPASELVDLHYHRRLLARVFHSDPDRWVLKGGQALLMRWPTARYSTDIDLLSAQNTTDAAVEDLIKAASLELDDHLRFAHHDTTEQTHVDRPTRSVRFRAMFGNVVLKWVSVDVVVSDYMPRGDIATEPLEAPFTTECETWPEVRIFPLEDHVAEKLCAMYERYRADGNPSSRYKDLVDLVLIALKSPINGPRMHATLQDEIERRRNRGMVLTFPEAFEVPDKSWTAGYRSVASGVRELPADLRTLAGVQELADAFITPLLAAKAPVGSWNPDTRGWR
ncbi:nucleotidyl transferase AbiEii/AbiGii toxin family protein [Amycolatopsis sp. ATCC 39116]|uniref:nucleotidyl transferase AbiEii/AbiGii toxin family protein n=1 Tax=Amycolatopsis sp. (strain ATCC 39116 / 75iv2) TaxID=385957 RepID=UPI0002625904|nr:nucleotidyl transferase AbiEii/AbiGii toxin family protein [Amycolatopsis sp. ATCC 39116]